MKLIDTHAHLFTEDFNEDIADVIERAKKEGIEQVLLPNMDENTLNAMHQLQSEYPEFFKCMAGIHPCYVTKDYEKQLELITRIHNEYNYIAVGEIGIDLYWDKSLIKEQKAVFKAQLELAKKIGIPVAIHARNAFNEIFEVMDEVNDEHLTGVLHCFTGGLDEANKIIDYQGFKIGVGGVVTFKNSGLDKVIEQIDLQHLILETDAPYLSPTPKRGKRNESAYLVYIAQKLAEIHDLDPSEIAHITTKNAKELFKC